MTEPRPIGTIWIHSQHACSGCGREHQALCQMSDGTYLCVSCQYAPGETGPDLPEGWQYGVVTADGRVWGCGDGADGQARQRMRLRYANTEGPCMLPLHVVGSDDLEITDEMVERAAVEIAGGPPCYCPHDTRQTYDRWRCPEHGDAPWPVDHHRREARQILTAALHWVGPSEHTNNDGEN